jgi:hypothetical protein
VEAPAGEIHDILLHSILAYGDSNVKRKTPGKWAIRRNADPGPTIRRPEANAAETELHHDNMSDQWEVEVRLGRTLDSLATFLTTGEPIVQGSTQVEGQGDGTNRSAIQNGQFLSLPVTLCV